VDRIAALPFGAMKGAGDEVTGTPGTAPKEGPANQPERVSSEADDRVCRSNDVYGEVLRLLRELNRRRLASHDAKLAENTE
jgi:hypothetical protein